MRTIRFLLVSALTVGTTGIVASGCGDPAEYGEMEEIGHVQSMLPVRPLPTTDPPYLEAAFTTPLQFAIKDQAEIPTGSGSDQIRNQLSVLIGYAQDVGSATDVHISAYDWDQFWNTGPSLFGGAWPSPICGKTNCCDGSSDCGGCSSGGCNMAECSKTWNVVQDAVDRNLEVKALFNEGKSKEPVRKALADSLATKPCRTNYPDDRWCGVRTCDAGVDYCANGACECKNGGSCLGTKEMHAKFVLVRNFDMVAPFVHSAAQFNSFVTSANFDYDQTLNWNDAVTVYNDRLLYEGLQKYFNAMWDQGQGAQPADNPSGAQFPLQEMGTDVIDGARGIVRAYLFPRNEQGTGDIVHKILANVTGTTSTTKVLVVQSKFTSPRIALAQKLAALSRGGADVRVILRDRIGGDDPDVSQNVADTLQAGGVKIFKTSHRKPYGSRVGVGIHHKFFLINGAYNGVSQRLVFAGTHNWSDDALRENEELLLKIRECETPPCTQAFSWDSPRTGTANNNRVYLDYAAHWNNLCEHVVRYPNEAIPAAGECSVSTPVVFP
jgi:hypothetical protein